MRGLGWAIAQSSAVAIGLAIGLMEGAVAQIVPDGTLGADGSRVTPNVTIRGSAADRIDGGAQRGQNLFHSFQEFNIGNGQRVYFANPADVRNILTRVTGNNLSNIQGTLGVQGGANLFLMNPNGIVFGQNARLDIGGSFVGTTANAIGFGNQGFFSATNAEAPSPLLTVQPSAFLFNQISAGNITNSSMARDQLGILGLRVDDGQNLLLLGGNITNNGGELNAFGGRVEIGAVVGIGVVELNANGSFSFPEGLARGDVTFTNGASVDVRLNTGGNIGITARNIELSNGSNLFAGIFSDSGVGGSQAGDIALNAIGDIRFLASDVGNTVGRSATGNGGNLNITARSLLVEGGSQLAADTEGQGNAGNVNINSNRIVLDDSTIFSKVNSGAIGNGGNISIGTRSLSLSNGAILTAGTSGHGNAGNVLINANDRIELSRSSAIITRASRGAIGNGGNISINTGLVYLSDGSQLQTGIFGRGNAGDVSIEARDHVGLSGRSTFIRSSVEQGGEGRGGNINIDTRSLSLSENATLIASTLGKGNAGNISIDAHDRIELSGLNAIIFSSVASSAVGNGGSINIDTRSLSLSNDAQLVAGTDGRGNAGNVTINASNYISLDSDNTGIITSVQQGAVGNGGSINIDTRLLTLSNGSQLVAGTAAQGNAGNININANDIVLHNGGILSRVDSGAVGNGGSINIDTKLLSLFDGAQLSSSMAGQGNAGNVNINASDVKLRHDSTILSRVNSGAVGNGGNINIHTRSLTLFDGAQLSASMAGQGNAGNVNINADNHIVFEGDDTAIFTLINQNGEGRGGNIIFKTQTLSLSDGAQLVASTIGQGNAGDVNIQATRLVSLTGTNSVTGRSSGIFSSNFSTTTGQGGRIRVTTPTLTIANGAVVDARTATPRLGGNVILNAGSLNLLNGGQVITSTFDSGQAGDIILNADRITLSGRDSTFAQRQTQFLDTTLNVERGESGLFTNTDRNSTGRAGDINIRTRQLNIRDNAEVAVNSRGTGQAGNLTVSANDIRLDRGTLTAETRSTNKQEGANIRLQDIDRLLYLQNGSQISARAFDNANGGNVTINANNGFVVARTGANQNNDIIARANGGNGGQVSITAQGILGFEQRPSTSANITNDIDVSSDQGLQGTVTLNIPNVDPSRGLAELPTVPTDATNQIASACPTTVEEADRLGSFIVSGRGGIPASPIDLLSGDNTLTEWVTPSASHPHAQLSTVKTETAGAIVEAQGLALSPEGKVMLIAPASPSHQPPTCQQK